MLPLAGRLDVRHYFISLRSGCSFIFRPKLADLHPAPNQLWNIFKPISGTGQARNISSSLKHNLECTSINPLKLQFSSEHDRTINRWQVADSRILNERACNCWQFISAWLILN